MSEVNTVKEVKLIKHKCRQCLTDLTFAITNNMVQSGEFPIKLEQVHGEPPHKIILYINKALEVESFEIKEELEKRGDSFGALEEVLGDIGLSQKESELYFHCTRLGPVSVGEMALLIELPPETVSEIAKKFVEKGLFKEIPGVTQYFQALPPYAALLEQLKKFGGFISTIKGETPRDLQRSFGVFEDRTKGVQNLKEFVTYLQNIKKEVSDKLGTQSTALERTLDRLKNQQGTIPFLATMREKSKTLLDRQAQAFDQNLTQSVKVLDQQFGKIDQQLASSVTRLDHQMEGITRQLGVMQEKITRNLEKLRLGVIQQTVQDVIQKIMQNEIANVRKTFQDEIIATSQRMFADLKADIQQGIGAPAKQMLEGMKENFQNEFGAPFHSLLTELGTKIENVSSDAGKIDDDLRKSFTSIRSQFDHTLTDASDRIEGISNSVMSSFGELRNTFGEKVIVTLDDVLGQIYHRLDLNVKTIEEFWQEAKRVVRTSAKDIWFVRTPEGMKAQIIDGLSRSKMKVLIITPTLSEIDVPSVLAAPKFVNIRIATKVNPDDPKHREILDTLSTHANISVRRWDLRNLWAINRDFEEIIVGIVSKETIGSDGSIDVAGIGSTLEEHIKIFAGILEDAWVGSHKELGYLPKGVPAPEEPEPAPAPRRGLKPPTVSVKLTPVPPLQSRLPPVQVPEPSTPITSSAPDLLVKKVSEPGSIIAEILERIDELDKNIDSYISPVELAKDLEVLRDHIFEKKGFHTILHDIKNWINTLRHGGKWDAATKETLHKRVESWKEKLVT